MRFTFRIVFVREDQTIMRQRFVGRQMSIVLVFLLSILIVPVRSSAIDLSISPRSGAVPENIVIRCEIPPVSPSNLNKLENVYLSVKTDDVKPSGIVLMFDDGQDRCEKMPNKIVQIDVCNSTLILVRMSHTVLNQTVEKIEYSCSKGLAQAIRSYRINSKRRSSPCSRRCSALIDLSLEDQLARYIDPMDNHAVKHTSTLLVFVSLLWRIFLKHI